MINNIFLFTLLLLFSSSSLLAQDHSEPIDYVQLSVELLEAVRDKKDTKKYQQILAEAPFDSLDAQLTEDKRTKTFWLNIYNSYIMIILGENPEYFDDRRSFFSNEQIEIAGEKVSFERIEHGYIRKSMVSWGLGILPNFFPNKRERRFRVDERDWRIHFALNCGAKSCPPVAIYRPETVDQQLDIMTANYLNEVTDYSEAKDLVRTTTLFSWFRGDFGHKSGVKNILLGLGLIPDKKVDIEYKDYSWELSLYNFVSLNL